jgi:hypothetical protein
MPIRAALALALLTLLAPGAVTARSLDAEAPRDLDLSGDWQLDPSQSDDPHKVLLAARAKLIRKGGPPRPIVPLDASGRPSADPEGDRDAIIDQNRRAAQLLWARLESLLQSPGRLQLTQTPGVLVVKSEDGTDEFEAGGGRTIVSFGNGGGERQAGWHHRDFIVETRGGDGTTQERDYSLDAAGNLLLVTRLSGGGGPKFVVRSVYVRGSGKGTPDLSRVPAT